MEPDFQNLCKGVVICGTHDLFYNSDCNVIKIVQYKIETKNCEQKNYNISAIILDSTLKTKNQEIEKMIKDAYRDKFVNLEKVNEINLL